MANPWELILHHTYAGTPGVAYDSSPGHGGHGRVMDGLSAANFVADGASPGSGAIGFPKKELTVGGTVAVATFNDSWIPLQGLYCEIVCRFDFPSPFIVGGGTLLESALFSLGVERYKFENLPAKLVAWAEFRPQPDNPAWSVRVPEYVGADIPANEWVTLGFLYDGLSTARLLINGTVAEEAVMALPPMGSPQQLAIGPIFGLIDDVQIWRLNPTRVTNNFVDRPMDSSTARCLYDWMAQAQQVLAADPRCADRFLTAFDSAMRSGLTQVLASDDGTRQIWQQAITDYQQAWSQGRFDDIPAIIANLAQLQAITDAFDNSDPVRLLHKDPCVQKILAALPPLTCDPELKALADSIAAITVPGERLMTSTSLGHDEGEES